MKTTQEIIDQLEQMERTSWSHYSAPNLCTKDARERLEELEKNYEEAAEMSDLHCENHTEQVQINWRLDLELNEALKEVERLKKVLIENNCKGAKTHDPVNHPAHYTGHPSGVEAIQICEHMTFCRGNAMKYIFRAGLKGDEVEDLKKAVWYLQREIQRIQNENHL